MTQKLSLNMQKFVFVIANVNIWSCYRVFAAYYQIVRELTR